MFLFDTPISQTKVSKYVMAYKYKNGVIEIDGQKFIGYSMTEAIKIFRKRNK